MSGITMTRGWLSKVIRYVVLSNEMSWRAGKKIG